MPVILGMLKSLQRQNCSKINVKVMLTAYELASSHVKLPYSKYETIYAMCLPFSESFQSNTYLVL